MRLTSLREISVSTILSRRLGRASVIDARPPNSLQLPPHGESHRSGLAISGRGKRRRLARITTWAIAMTNTQGSATTMRAFPWSRLPTLLGSDAYCYIYRGRRRYIATQKSFLLVALARPFVARDRLPSRLLIYQTITRPICT